MLSELLIRVWRWIVSSQRPDEVGTTESLADFVVVARSIEELQVDLGLQSSNGRLDLYLQLLTSVRVHMPTVLKRMDRKLADNSFHHLAMEVRSLRNILRYMGAERLSTRADELEQTLISSDMELYKSEVRLFTEELRNFTNTLEQLSQQ